MTSPIRSFMFRWRMVLLVLMLLVVLLSQCVSVRMSDKKVARYFAERPVKPTFATVPVNGYSIHYARVVAPTPGASTPGASTPGFVNDHLNQIN